MSRSYQSGARSPGTSRRRPAVGRGAHNLTHPKVFDRALRLAWSGSVGFVEEYHYAATRTQRFQKVSIRATFCSTVTSLLPADKITSSAPTMLYVASGGTTNQKTFPPAPWATVSTWQFLDAHRQSNTAGTPLLKIRSSEPFYQAHEECHAHVLVQTCESEVVACAKISSPVTLKQHYESFVAAPQGFSRSAGGGGVHSSGDWLAPRTGNGDIFKDLRHAVVEIVSNHRLHHAAKAAWAVQSRSPFVQDEHNDEIREGEATKSFLQAAGLRRDLSIVPGQPFRLGLIRHPLLLMHDPDTGLIDIAESGFHTGVFEPIKCSGIWSQQSDAPEDLHFEVCDTSWKSTEEDPDTVTCLLQEDIECQVRPGVPQ